MRDKIGEEARLLHIRDAINYIKEFVAGKTDDNVARDIMLRSALERQLEIIGEASGHLSAELKSKAAQIDWVNIKAFRNIVAHEYSVSLGMIHKITRIDIPELESAIAELLKNNFGR